MNITEFLYYVGCYKCNSSRHIEKNNGFKIEHKSDLLRLETLNIVSLHVTEYYMLLFLFQSTQSIQGNLKTQNTFKSKLNPKKRFYECRQPAA